MAACTASIGANAIVAATIAAIAGCVKLCGIFIAGLVRITAAGGGAIGPRCTRSASDAVINCGASSIGGGEGGGGDAGGGYGPGSAEGSRRICAGIGRFQKLAGVN